MFSGVIETTVIRVSGSEWSSHTDKLQGESFREMIQLDTGTTSAVLDAS